MTAQDSPARTPEPPYYAVLFTSVRHEPRDGDGYLDTAAQMLRLAAAQPGYLGVEQARESIGISVCYWRDLESIRRWKQHTDHALAQQRGRADWYERYVVRIARVEREYEWTRDA